MITARLLDGLLCHHKHDKETRKRHHFRLLACTFATTAVLIVVGYLMSHEKVVEYGTLWLFEQFIGGAKAAAFGGPPAE